MPSQPPGMNPNYLAMERGVRELHALIAQGKEDSPEADAIRDATDGPWETLSEIERRRVLNLAEDLYSLHEPVAPGLQLSAEAQSKFVDAVEAPDRDVRTSWPDPFRKLLSRSERRRLPRRLGVLGLNRSICGQSQICMRLEMLRTSDAHPTRIAGRIITIRSRSRKCPF